MHQWVRVKTAHSQKSDINQAAVIPSETFLQEIPGKMSLFGIQSNESD